jgi:hypothetical protein
VCLGSLGHRFTALVHEDALWKLQGHFERRDRACRDFFPTWRPSETCVPARSAMGE